MDNPIWACQTSTPQATPSDRFTGIHQCWEPMKSGWERGRWDQNGWFSGGVTCLGVVGLGAGKNTPPPQPCIKSLPLSICLPLPPPWLNSIRLPGPVNADKTGPGNGLQDHGHFGRIQGEGGWEGLVGLERLSNPTNFPNLQAPIILPTPPQRTSPTLPPTDAACPPNLPNLPQIWLALLIPSKTLRPYQPPCRLFAPLSLPTPATDATCPSETTNLPGTSLTPLWTLLSFLVPPSLPVNPHPNLP